MDIFLSSLFKIGISTCKKMKTFFLSPLLLLCKCYSFQTNLITKSNSHLFLSTQDGLKSGLPDGPPGSPPGGPTKGSPRGPSTGSQNEFLENFFEIAFSILYIGDDSGIIDSSKNLRVLWTRALLSSLGKINDPIAFELLPTKTRWIVSPNLASFWEGPGSQVVDKLDWIVKRTQFIDEQLDSFINQLNGKGQIIVLGSGYDTRALRYNHMKELTFFEIDLTDISSMKKQMIQRYRNGKGNHELKNEDQQVFIPFDLNTVSTKKESLIGTLKASGLKEGIPTMVICEAVLFYLIPDAAKKIVSELFEFPMTRYCITDNLSKLGVAPGPPVPTPREKCESWLNKNDKELITHDAIWGGAIHFVAAK